MRVDINKNIKYISLFDNVGVWPNEDWDGNNYESPVVISTKIVKRVEYWSFDLCGPDGTVFIDLDRKVFCALDYFELPSESDELIFGNSIEGCYYQFYTFSDALKISNIVDNETETNKHILHRYEQQLRFILTTNEIKGELAKKNENHIESRIVAGQKESYLDLFNRHQSCLQLKDKPHMSTETEKQTKSNDKADESSEPPKKRQRVC